jgi:pyruvate/2-oxoglutarate dehydrogenase complex dihydrolipoamide acyltransferase (E2) component
MHQVRLPKLGLTMEEGVVVEWHVSVGDRVEEGIDLVTIGSDKADTVVSSPCAGKVAEILSPAGEVHPVGHVICVIEEG